MKILLAVLTLALGGCQSITKQLDSALPEGKASKATFTITGKFSATTGEAINFDKTADKVTADKLHVRHSNAWVPLVEFEIDGYERDRK